MPKSLPAVYMNAQAEIPSLPANSESSSLLVNRLKAVTPSPSVFKLPQQAWQWMARLFGRAPQAERVEMTEVVANGRELHQASEEAALLNRQLQEGPSRPSHPHARLILAVVSAFATVGTLGLGLGLYRMKNSPDTPMPDNNADMIPDFQIDQLFPHARAVAAPGAALISPTTVMPTPTNSANSKKAVYTLLSKTLFRNELDEVLKHYPGMDESVVTEAVFVPLLMKLEGDAPLQPSDDVTEASQQLSLMIDALFSTLTAQEFARLYQSNSPGGELQYAWRFAARNEQANIVVDKKPAQLWLRPDNTPFIIDEHGRCNFVRFNQQSKKWEIVREYDNLQYATETGASVAKYTIPLVTLAPNYRVEADPTNNLININIPGKNQTTGVMIAGEFIPARCAINQCGTAYTNITGYENQQQLLVRSDYGWYFEPASVKMDQNLKLLLESKNNVTTDASAKQIGEINTKTGLSISDIGKNFLKKDHKYYPVNIKEDKANKRNITTLPDFDNAEIRYNNGMMQLINALEIIVPFESEKIKVNSPTPCYIEKDAMDYLDKHCKRTEPNLAKLKYKYNGVWVNDKNYKFFTVQDKTYIVHVLADRHIRILNANNYARGYDIILKLIGDTLLRIRNHVVQIPYTALPTGDMSGLSSGKIKLPVFMETDVYNKLQNANNGVDVSESAATNGELINKKGFDLPLVWINPKTNNSYFLHNNKYFPATIIEEKNSTCPMGLNIIEISAQNNFLTDHNNIATIVIEKKTDKYEIKSQESLFAERMKVSTDMAASYISKFPWRHVAGMELVDEAVSKVLASNNFYVDCPKKPVKLTYQTWDIESLKNNVTKMLYPGNVNFNQLEFYTLATDQDSPDIKKTIASNYVKSAIERLKTIILNSLQQALYYNTSSWPVVKSYLNDVLGIDSDEFHTDFAYTWRERLKKIKDSLAVNKVLLTYGSDVVLTDDEKKSGNIVYTSPSDRVIYINANKLDPDDETQIRLISELLHSVAYMKGVSSDFIDTRQENNIHMPAMDAQKKLISALQKKELPAQQLNDLLEESKKYFKHVPPYQNSNSLLTSEALSFLAKFDPAYRAHLMLYSASFLTSLSLDTFFLLAQAQNTITGVEAWLKKYGELRSSPMTNAYDESTAQTTLVTNENDGPHGEIRYFHHPLASAKISKDRFSPIQRAHDKIFIPDQGDYYPQKPEEKVFVPGHGNVTIVEIPELYCLGDKDLTFSEELRQIGRSLENTVTANAQAWQEILYVDLRIGDCPPPKDVQWLTSITTTIDLFINTVISFIPRLEAVDLLKGFVGPMLQMLADDIEGKPVSKEERLAMILNVALTGTSIVRQEMPTFTSAERANFIRNPSIKKIVKAKAPNIMRRFSSYRGSGRGSTPMKVAVKIAGKDFPLRISYDEKPLINNEQGLNRFIHFDRKENHWNFDTDIEKVVEEEAKRNQNEFRMRLKKLPEEAVIEPAEFDFFTIKQHDQEDITGVFIGVDFIPAEMLRLDNEISARTTLGTISHQQQRLLTWDESGWSFERKSVKAGDYIDILLNSKEDTGENIAQNVFGAIRKADGLSPDKVGHTYIKRDYKYYKAEKLPSTDGQIRLKLPDHDDAVLKFENGYFSLEHADNILVAFKNKVVTDQGAKFHIEESGLLLLQGQAARSTEHLTVPLGHGLYTNEQGSHTAFVVNNEHFLVSFHTDKEMHIKIDSADVNAPPLTFWLDKDSWVRIRDKSKVKNFDYTELSSCRIARTPGAGTSCLGAKIAIETTLSKRLINEISNGMASDRVPDAHKLVEVRVDEIPFLYQDPQTTKYYFKYANKFFNAKIIEASNKVENPTGFPCLKITGRTDFFRREKNISLMVVIDDGDTIKMADMSTFVAEKLKVSPQEATLYNRKSLYNEVENINMIDRLINDVQMADNLYVEQPIKKLRPLKAKITEKTLLDAAKKSLFPRHVLKNKQYKIKVYDLDAPAPKNDDYVDDAIDYVSRQVDYAQNNILTSVTDALRPDHHNHPLVEDYFMEIFQKDDNVFMNDLESSFLSHLNLAKEELSRRKIKLLSVVEEPLNTHPQYLKSNNEVVFIHDLDKDNIFINIDMIEIDQNAKHINPREFTGALLEAAHRATGTTDHIFNIPKSNSIYLNVKDAYRYIQNALRKDNPASGDSTAMMDVITRYFKASPVYRQQLDKLLEVPMDWRKFSYFLRNDPGFRAQLTLNSDSFSTLIPQDLHYLISSVTQDTTMLHPWVKKYGQRRNVLKIDPATEQIADLMTTVRVDVHLLAKEKITILTELPEKKNLFSSEEYPIVYQWNDELYPADFLGKSARIITLGNTDEIRQVYYYYPITGAIEPIQKQATRNKVLTYHDDIELFESRVPGSDYSEILSYDALRERLVPTGATRILHLPGDITRIEFPSFNVFHPKGATNDIYMQGHGKALQTHSAVPENCKLNFYTYREQQLVPYKGNADDLLRGKFEPREFKVAGQIIEDYVIKPFSSVPVNHYHMAKKYNANFVQVFSSDTHSSDLISSISNVFHDHKIEIHLYMCRAVEDKRMFPPVPGTSGLSFKNIDMPFAKTEPTDRWIFDQPIEGGRVEAGPTLSGFLPLREINIFTRFKTADLNAKACITYFLHDTPYDIYYGLHSVIEPSNQVPAYIMGARIQARKNMIKAHTNLDKAWDKLNDNVYSRDVMSYFSFAFDVSDENILQEVVKRFKINVSRVRDFLDESAQIDYNNVGIVSTRQIPDLNNPGTYKSAISDIETINNFPAAFMVPGDAFRRIYIVNDKYPVMKTGDKIIDRNDAMQPHVFTHEASHIAANTFDITYIKMDIDDYASGTLNIADAQRGMQQINELIASGKIKNTQIWSEFVPLINRYFSLKTILTEAEAVQILKESPMLRANLLAENADSFAIFVKHIADLKHPGKQKREAEESEESASNADYKHLALLFAATKAHHVPSEE
ncbi:putative adhesin [Salmonella enterica]